MNAVISKFFECITCRIIAVAKNVKKNHGKSCNIAKKSCCYGKVYLSKKKYFPSLHIVNLKRLLLVVEIIFIPECRKMDYRDRVENCK